MTVPAPLRLADRLHLAVIAACCAATVAATVASRQADADDGLSPEESLQQMKAAEGFEVRLVVSEPLVRQPVAIEFDDRGRLWVIQYLQYPNPAGLKRVQVDRYSRTKYDRIPQPPPHGPRGADRITILQDTDGDGRMDRGRDFVSGLNLATGIAFGHGGVFVLNVPYLLFYPDRDRDDVPDGDPQVLLKGFGMEDAHSVANSLTWGPDGWLYGCQGSTVTARIRGVEFQQGVWRYHPVTDRFELFCEGGGNSWGLDFDAAGRLLYSTNYGGYVLLHGVQGGYYVKSFAKHGELHNRHAYGYFNHAPHTDFRGGHVTVGGIVYQGDSLPEEFRGRYIAGDLLGHGVYWHDVKPLGSTVRTAHGGELLQSDDTWFAPTDVTMGPDGAIYVSDWHDARTAHPDPDAEWDRSNGRIYRIAASGTRPAEPIDFAALDAQRLLALHRHRSQWYVRRARAELARRRQQGWDPAEVTPKLRQQLLSPRDDGAALEALWTLHVLGQLDEDLAARLLDSPHPAVRSWTVRLMGDAAVVSDEMAHRLDSLAEQEDDVEVRQQLACTAQRLPARQALPIINAHVVRDLDHDDPFLPLLWWWAVERHSLAGRDEVLARFVRPTLWKSRLGRETLLPRLIRRYASEGGAPDLDAVVALLKAAPDERSRRKLWPAVLQGWDEAPPGASRTQRAEVAKSHEFSQLILDDWQSAPDDSTLLALAIKLGRRRPLEAATADAFDSSQSSARRAELLGMLAGAGDESLIGAALRLTADMDAPEVVRRAALRLLARFDEPQIAARLMELHSPSGKAQLDAQIREILLSRQSSARLWLAAVDRGDVEAEVTPLEEIRRVALLEDEELDALVVKHWGRLEGAARGEKLAEVRRLNNDLRAGRGDGAAGRLLFKKHCAACHQLFGEGEKVGPDLTSANRQDRDFLLISLVDPDHVVRVEYLSLLIRTTDGRVLTGLPVARDGAGVTLVNSKNERVVVPSSEIAELRSSPVSIMPSDLYRQLTPQQLRDLFAHLSRTGLSQDR